MEDLNFLLKSGIVLCRLIHKIFPQSQIDLEALQVRFSLQHLVWVSCFLLRVQSATSRTQVSPLFPPYFFQSGNLNTKKKNISQFLISALAYGLPERYLFKPDDVVVMAHFHKYAQYVEISLLIRVRYSGSPERCSPWRRGPRWTPTLLGSPSATQIWRVRV